MKTFFIKTLGCKVNQCDSQRVRQTLIDGYWKETRDSQGADVRIVNTCCVTHQAARKSRAAIRSACRHRTVKGGRVVVFGCYPSYDRPAVKGIPGIDLIFGQNQKRELSRWLMAQHNRRLGKDQVRLGEFGAHTRAFMKIQDGCNNQCSYCVVPVVRGRSVSRSVRELVAQARAYVNAGHKEIVLTGIDMGSFGEDLRQEIDLVGLISQLEEVEGLERIRLSSVEARDISARLIQKMKSSKKMCAHLHIPFQSGDDDVLRAMHRRMKRADYLRVLDSLRKHVKDCTVSCDMIVGFPTETQECFENTLAFVKRVRPLKVHVFPFSSRPGTPAASLEPLASSILQERVNRVKELALETSQRERLVLRNKVVEVLFENQQDGLWQDLSRNYVRVFVKAPSLNLHNEKKMVCISGLWKDGVEGRIEV